MKKKIAIIDYGAGNILSLQKAINYIGYNSKITNSARELSKFDMFFLPGVGAFPKAINSLKNNAQLGKGDWAVIEADESDGSFLKLPITYSIVTNLDKEHLDFYGSFKKLKECFSTFVRFTIFY